MSGNYNALETDRCCRWSCGFSKNEKERSFGERVRHPRSDIIFLSGKSRQKLSEFVSSETTIMSIPPHATIYEDPSSAQASTQDQSAVLLILTNFWHPTCIGNGADLPPPTRYVRRPRARRSERIQPANSSFEDVCG